MIHAENERSFDAALRGMAYPLTLGLIVTELVINALKHAFTNERSGTIVIEYQSSGKEWTLSISDDGIGIPTGKDAPKAGLGTGIVEALVKNLKGEITVSNVNPGTMVTIIHQRPRASGPTFFQRQRNKTASRTL